MNRRTKKYSILFFTLFLSIMLVVATVCLIRLVRMDAHASAVKLEKSEGDQTEKEEHSNSGDSLQHQHTSRPLSSSTNYTVERPKVDSIDGIPLTVDLIPNGSEGRPGTKRIVQYVVIHETGNTDPGTGASNHARLLASGENGSTSWHYTVDDHEIWHSFPDDEVAYHAGDGRDGDGNLYGIGVELCVNADGDFEKTFDNAAKLTGWLMHTYHLSQDAIKEHYDFTGKNCPQTIRETGRMAEFIEKAQAYADALEEQ